MGYAGLSGDEAITGKEGSQTGIGIGLDDFSGIGTDVIGFSVRVDGELVEQIAVPTLNGLVNDPTSLQTGTDAADLGWAQGLPCPQPRGRVPPQLGHPVAGSACSDTFLTTGHPVLTGSERRWLSRALSKEHLGAPTDPLTAAVPSEASASGRVRSLMCRRTSETQSARSGPYLQTKKHTDATLFHPQGYPQVPPNPLKRQRSFPVVACG